MGRRRRYKYGFCESCEGFRYTDNYGLCASCRGHLVFEGVACTNCGFVEAYEDSEEDYDGICPECGARLLDIQSDGYDYVHIADGVMEDMFPDGEDDGHSVDTYPWD